MKKILSNILCSTACFLSISTYAENTVIHNITYESAEHIFAGDQVRLKGLSPNKNKLYSFTLPNKITLTYGEILSMPDYYGDPDHQISSEKTFSLRKKRFNTVYSDFAHYDTAYFHAFWPIVIDERKKITEALKNHQSVSNIYNTIVDKENITLAIATKMRYLTLAAHGMDHFNPDSVKAYQAGHSVSIDSALTGYQIRSGLNPTANNICQSQPNITTCLNNKALRYLQLAYAQNAYASHFLSDRFAAGHIRTPYRKLLETRPIPALGGLSGGMMHNEDNKFGLIVTNNSGQYWMAYGDNYYFSPQNKTNKEIQQQVLQLSADEIYSAYQDGYNPDPQSVNLIKKLPEPIAANTYADVADIGHIQQTVPLYEFKQGIVWQRQDVNDRHNNQYTPFWSTLVTLLTYHKTDQPKISSVWKMILEQQKHQ